MKKILFYDENLNERGTSVATYDYAYYNQKILGNRSIIVSTKDKHSYSYQKYKKSFDIVLINDINDINKIKCDYFYYLKWGFNDGILHQNAKSLVHVVFPIYEPHGDSYVYISKWLADNCGNDLPYVPHMVNLPKIKTNLKNKLNIKDQLVIGWYGGNNFEIPFAIQAVIDVANKRKDIVFLFMNMEPFCDIKNVLFLELTTDINEKVSFINTCDAMIHARERGETFGLAIAEFSSMNKPIITYYNSPERCHIDILKNKGIYYTDYQSLTDILYNIQHSDINNKDWNCYTEFNPENVINKFKDTFIK